jgi:hypothetical protein
MTAPTDMQAAITALVFPRLAGGNQSDRALIVTANRPACATPMAIREHQRVGKECDHAEASVPADQRRQNVDRATRAPSQLPSQAAGTWNHM